MTHFSSDFLINLICLEGFIYSFIFFGWFLSTTISCLHASRGEKDIRWDIGTSGRREDTLPSPPSWLWATAVESPLMTSRKKSAGLLCVSHVYPVKQKVLLNVSCADYGGVAKTSFSYQCLRSTPTLSVPVRGKPERFNIKNDNGTFFTTYL